MFINLKVHGNKISRGLTTHSAHTKMHDIVFIELDNTDNGYMFDSTKNTI